MRTLILMRHGKSDWSEPALSDHDRPLNKRGRRAVPLVAQKFLDEGLKADVILASSAKRVQETVELLCESWSPDAELLTKKELYLASPEEIARQVEALHDAWKSALVVGHNPGMLGLLCYLADRELEMPTASAAVFESDSSSWLHSIGRRRWKFIDFWKPRQLEAE